MVRMNTEHIHCNSRYKSSLIGFILSMALTLLSFFTVKFFSTYKNISIIILMIFAILQFFVHLIYFFHLSFWYKQKWNITSLIFALFISVILIAGSFWIMSHLHHNLISH